MLLKDEILTCLRTIPITIATPINKGQAINPPNNLNLTFTRVYDQEKLFNELTEILRNLETKEKVSEEEISAILPIIVNLTPGSDNRSECDFRIRSLMKKFKSPVVVKQNSQKTTVTREQILGTINQSNDIDKVHVALIELNEKEFINLGREGRVSVVKQLVLSKKVYKTEQELVDDLQAKVKNMNQLLETINSGVKEIADFIQLLDEMNLPLYSSLSTEIKEAIVDHLLHQNTKFNSVASLANGIEKKYESMDRMRTTLSVDNPSERKLILGSEKASED